ncbi:hypothetical protein WUBG_02366 [Wuchereria bancrofti]|uniref:Uncharacterized protein n=1 Tax=Wuchereria bancrofti TaxID=6293 RepID=J9FAX4_WUCBA|nr:hypothetical protein WUBG_02366 [Wuchereria bancrofti]
MPFHLIFSKGREKRWSSRTDLELLTDFPSLQPNVLTDHLENTYLNNEKVTAAAAERKMNE